MSVEMMSLVFKKYPVGGGEMLLALAFADHADDQGCRIFPSVATLAVKTRQSERGIQYQMRKMEKDGFLVLVKNAKGGRYNTREYRINLDFFEKGANFAPFVEGEKGANGDTKGCKLEHERVQTDAQKGATAIAPESSRTIREPSVKPSVASKSLPPTKISFDSDKNKFTIPMSCYDGWESVFPKLDLDAEIDKAELWLSANPKRRKKNYERFLLGWFTRAAENAKPKVFARPQPGAHAR